MTAALIMGILALMLITGTPISIALGMTVLVFLLGFSSFDMQTVNIISQRLFTGLESFAIMAVPFFVLAGQFLIDGKIANRIIRFANNLVGWMPGGMAMAAVLACAAFGSISGSTVATTATIAQVAYPEMRRVGYSGRLSTAALATGGTMGVLLPPSVTLMVYAILTEQNIVKTFLAAYVPAALAALGYLIAIAVTVRLRPATAPAARAASGAEVTASLLQVWPIVLVFLVVFGGIYGGYFTATEGAAIGTMLTFITALAQRQMSWRGFLESIRTTAQTSGMIFMIFIGADMINAALALSQLPNQLAELVAHASIPPVVVMGAIMLFYVALGCVMDEMSMILLTVPVLFPVIMGLDFGMPPADKALWFGVLILTVCAIGMIFPPVGLNVYIMNSLAKDVPMGETYRGVVPFLVTDFIRLGLLIAFPSISLWLVRLLS